MSLCTHIHFTNGTQHKHIEAQTGIYRVVDLLALCGIAAAASMQVSVDGKAVEMDAEVLIGFRPKVEIAEMEAV